MKILKHGRDPEKLTGKCRCGCEVECTITEANCVVDRDSPGGAYHVTCPDCKNPFLWVSDGKPTPPQPLPRNCDC